jgi:hypothetical protein
VVPPGVTVEKLLMITLILASSAEPVYVVLEGDRGRLAHCKGALIFVEGKHKSLKYLDKQNQ